MTDPHVIELLYFDGCPSHEQLLPIVAQHALQSGAELRLRRVEVPKPPSANASSARQLSASMALTSTPTRPNGPTSASSAGSTTPRPASHRSRTNHGYARR